MNENAESYLLQQLEYDAFSKLKSIKANAYDKDGNLFWTLAKSDIYDVKLNGGLAYMDDVRGKIFWLPSHSYPYTIEYSYTRELRNLLLSPDFYLYDNDWTSVEQSGIQITVPKNLSYKFKTKNLDTPTDSIVVGNKMILTWQEENISAQWPSYYEPSFVKTRPVVYFNVNDFEIEGYKGNAQTWESFGLWRYHLIEGRDKLEGSDQQKVLSLIQGISERKEKIMVLYDYLQEHTRYFNISYGIGGIQPIPASEVAKNGYGDCKALVNYMKAMLKVAGIESYYTLVMAGEGESIEADFPSNQFNHVILCVPDKNDTIWLECTDQEIPFGYLSGFTCDRDVLAITPKGGKLLHTPVYGLNDNLISTHSSIKLEATGDATANIRMKQSGLAYDELFAVSQSKTDDRLDWLAAQLGPATFNLERDTFYFPNTDLPEGTAEFDISIRDLSARSSDRLFFAPGLIAVMQYLTDEPVQFELDQSVHETDSVRVEIPYGYTIEFIPEYQSDNTLFGKYDYSITSDGRIINFTRNIEFYKGLYDKKDYAAFNDFVNDMAKLDRKMVVLKKL